MTPRHVLITGANGFVGTHLMRRLSDDFPEAGLHRATSDVTDCEAITAEIGEVMPDTCLHLAAVSAAADAAAAPSQAWNVNLHGTLNVAHCHLQDTRQPAS